MNGDTKLILSLINRISVKLPCNSKKKLEVLEQDPLILQIINAIIDLSRYKLSTIANNLTQLLESISKSSSMVLEEFVPIEVLQSQLLILKILSACMTNHWKYYRVAMRQSSDNSSFTGEDNSSVTTLVNQPKFKLPKSWEDPPPLEDSLAKYILNILSRFLHQMASQEDNNTGQPPTGSPAGLSPNPSTSTQGSSATFDIISDIYKNAGRVIFYISASNWNVVFSRIKTRIGYLTSTNDEWPETAELKLLECSDLNSKRLSMVLQELCGSFLHLKRSAQTMMANVLRKAIWNWIEVFPAEFVTLCQSQKRLDGGPEILFDYCNNLAESHVRKRSVFWPLQTMLLILCPDILFNASMSDRTSPSKRAAFLDSLKQSLRRSRLADVAVVCYVDICKASTYVAKNDSSALRLIVPDIENDLKARLFDPSRPFMNDSQIDQKLMTDCLTALFRLNQDTLESLIPVCLSENAPNAFKLVLVKSCYAIASEENRFPWNPSLPSVYSILAVPLRQLLYQYMNFRDKSNDLKKKIKAKEKPEELNEKMEIILNIIKLYKSDPMLALVHCDPDQHQEEIRQVIYGIALCVNDYNNIIRTTAAETLLELHNLEYIVKWGPEDMTMDNFWLISSQVMLAIARQILEFTEREDNIRYLLELLLQLFVRRNEFLKVHREISTVGIQAPERLGCNVVLEIALLVLLCSSDTDICSMSLNCFGHLCQEAQLTTEIIPDEMDVQTSFPNDLPIIENLDVYFELSSAPYLVPGRMAQQKRIRKLLRLMKSPTPGNLAAWEEAYQRWKMLNGIITAMEPRTRGLPWHPGQAKAGSNSVAVSEAQTNEWLNYTGFLCALGGVCVNDKQINNPLNGRINESLGNELTDRRNNGPHANVHLMVEKYVQEMVDLLVCDSVVVRENVKDSLGTELNPRLYVILFKHLESIVSRFFDLDGELSPTEKYTLFVEQAILVLKLILERIQDASENLYTVDLGDLVLSFALYLNRLGSSLVALRIKKRMCQLAEILMYKKDYVTLRQEIKLRNRLLEIFIEWTSDFTMKTDAQGSSSNETTPNKSEKLHRDLDQACLKTVVSLLQQLPLQPSETVHESDLSGVKSRLFYKYFSFFIKLLNRCRILEAIDSGTHSAKNNSDLQMLLSKSKEYVKDLGPLKDYTILALSNLLSANVDSGLKYSLSMGYHEDTKTRTAFMQVLTNILNQGTEFEGLAENAMKDRYEKLVELITESDLNIALSLCEVCPVSDIDEVAKTLLAVFDSRNKTMSLLKAIIEKEVISTEHESDLFRRNCMATRMLAAFAKTHGTEYLRETLQPLIEFLLSKPSDFSCELKPDNLGSDDVNQNLQNLISTAQAFLDGICASGPNMPRSFREVCHYISNSVEQKYKPAKFVTVGSFVFLRFFNPAIVAPDSENLCKPIENAKIRRALLLITKVIQNLANNVLFGAKEPFMIVLNNFLNENIVNVTTFLEEISKLPPTHSFADVPAGDNVNVRRLEDSERKALHRHLIENQEKMAKDLQTRRVKSINPASAPANIMLDQAQANKKTWDKISTLLAQLGPPAESQMKEFSNIGTNHFETNNQLFKEFMIRHKNRSIESIVSKRVFYDGGISKEKRRVFYLILRRLDAEATDMELLMYHVLKAIEPAMGKPYELLVDLTMFGAANEIQLQWVQQFMHVLPFDAIENLHTLYFYNTNTAFKKFFKKLARIFTSKVTRKIIFLCNLNELNEYISPAEIRLPKTTMQLDTDLMVVYTPVTRISHYRMQVPVIIKISHDTIQVLTIKKQDLINGLSCQLNDVYHISEIEDISISSHKNDDNEFTIKQDRGRPSLVFTSPKRDNIMSSIRSSKARYQIARPTNITERVIRPSDVPGTLLNMALLNIGSDDPNLRLAAYNLLVALSAIFNFDVGGQLLGAKGLCIPANNTSFVVGLSERLATSVPQLTPDFLGEFFVGFYKSSTTLKHLCLQYMAPWLMNLSQFTRSGADSQRNINRTREIIRNLIELTTKETEMYTAVQSKIWNTLGKVDEITNIIIEEFVQYAVDHGISSPQSEIIANTIVTLSSVNIRGKIIAKLRKVIGRTSIKATRTLTDNPAWPEIAVLIRFNLMLSFNNRNVQLYLPELFYVISILVATGPPLIRASIHGLIVNLVQSLCTSMPLNEISVKRLTLLLTELSEPNFRYFFGLNNVPGNAFVISSESTHDLPDTMPLASLEKIVQALLEVMVCGAGSIDMSNTWRARWMGLVASTAFQHNPAVQPRAFVTLGCLAREEVDDDLLYQILVALRGALSMFTENDCSLIISIVMCLTNIVENLPADCRYLQSLFWLAMALVQISHIPVFPSAINLLNVVLKALDVNNFFANEDIATVLLKARVPLESIAKSMDREAGVNYDHFSFAVSAILLKGLKNPVTKTGTKDVLNAFLDIASKGVGDQSNNIINYRMLGYLAALLPVSAKNADMKELLWVCGIVDSEVDNSELGTTYYKIFEKLDIPDNKTALLLISLMVAMLQTAEHEPERLFLYGFLAEAASALPQVFALVYDSLLPKMTQIINSSETIPILDSVQSILYTVISSETQFPSNRVVSRINQMPSYLEDIGFTNLMDCGSFQTITREKMKTNAMLASELVDKIISG